MSQICPDCEILFDERHRCKGTYVYIVPVGRRFACLQVKLGIIRAMTTTPEAADAASRLLNSGHPDLPQVAWLVYP